MPTHQAPTRASALSRVAALLALALAACVDTSTPAAPSHAITEADIAAVNALAAQLEATMAHPGLVSLLGVTVPFQARVPVVSPGLGHAARGRLMQLVSAGPTASLLGDAPVNPLYLGSTFVRAGTVFRRDTSRRDAPANAVRVLLYERIGGSATPNVVGWVDMADSVRRNGVRVTRASLGTAAQPQLATVRGAVTVQQAGVFGTALYDVLAGTIGGGTRPIVVSDSFVVDSTTGGDGRNVVTTTIPDGNAMVRTVTPAAPGLTFAQTRLLLMVGGRTYRVEVTRTGGLSLLSFYDGQTEFGFTNSAYFPNLGDGAQTRYGGVPGDVVRRWMNAVGRLLRATPSAADLAQAAGDLVTLLDPVIP